MAYIPQSPDIYQGKQAIINSDRILFNAKEDSILLFSDKAIGFSTKGNVHFDLGVITTFPDKATALNPNNPKILQTRKNEIDRLSEALEEIKSKNTKLV